MRRKITATRREINELDQSDGALSRQALKKTYRAVADLQRDGGGIVKGDTRLIYDEILGELKEGRAKEREKLVKQREGLEGQLEKGFDDWRTRREKAGIGAPDTKPKPDADGSTSGGDKALAASAKSIEDSVSAMQGMATDVVAAMMQVASHLGGESARLGRATG